MNIIEHVLVAYGEQIGYHHGAKFQILKCWERWYSRRDISICVITDKPKLFETYPVRILTLDESQKQAWSLNGIQHFGIKLKALQWALRTSKASKLVLLDTDMFWTKDPKTLLNSISNNSIVMYKDEGYVVASSNKSIRQFELALQNKKIPWEKNYYSLTKNSKMYGSAIIGISTEHFNYLDQAFSLFSTLESEVEAHTVEQFALAEVARLRGLNVGFAHKLTDNWSSTGKKEYITPILKHFFDTYGETDFENHRVMVHRIRVSRPVLTIAKQKITKWRSKQSPF